MADGYKAIRMEHRQRIPNLFLIGAPKCGTTAMSHYLAGHPDIFMSEQAGVKEPGYFADDEPKVFGARTIYSRQDYSMLFETASDSSAWIGEASICYLASGCAVPNILNASPGARFIVMVRNPIDIARGMHSQRVKRETEEIFDFEQAWRAQEARMDGQRLPPAFPEPASLQYGKLARIGEQLARLFDRVPKDRVHVIVYDDFIADSTACYSDLLQFLGVEDTGRNEFPVINQAKHYRLLRLQRALAVLSNVRQALGIPGGWGVHKMIDRYNYVAGAQPLRAEFRDELKRYFRSDVALLSRLLGQDLTSWTR